jgi:nitroreductase
VTSRRVVREFADAPIDEPDLVYILTAGRWATRGSNSRIHRLLVVQNRSVIRRVRAFSPGMLGSPAALIVICTDGGLAAAAEVQLDRDVTPWIDVGTAAMNMMLAAHALGLGSCPVTSFSKGAVAVVLKLPPSVVPEFIVQLGRPLSTRRMPASPVSRAALDDIVYWENYPG